MSWCSNAERNSPFKSLSLDFFASVPQLKHGVTALFISLGGFVRIITSIAPLFLDTAMMELYTYLPSLEHKMGRI